MPPLPKRKPRWFNPPQGRNNIKVFRAPTIGDRIPLPSIAVKLGFGGITKCD
jgi:hypothetical protein